MGAAGTHKTLCNNPRTRWFSCSVGSLSFFISSLASTRQKSLRSAMSGCSSLCPTVATGWSSSASSSSPSSSVYTWLVVPCRRYCDSIPMRTTESQTLALLMNLLDIRGVLMTGCVACPTPDHHPILFLHAQQVVHTRHVVLVPFLLLYIDSTRWVYFYVPVGSVVRCMPPHAGLNDPL